MKRRMLGLIRMRCHLVLEKPQIRSKRANTNNPTPTNANVDKAPGTSVCATDHDHGKEGKNSDQ